MRRDTWRVEDVRAAALVRFAFARRHDDPFVALAPVERLVVIGLALSLFPLAAAIAMTGGASTEPGRVIAFGAYVTALGFLIAAPRAAPGIFHPIVFYILWRGFRGIVAGEFSMAAAGLPYHRALAGWSPRDLDLVLIEHFALETVAILVMAVGYVIVPRTRLSLKGSPRLPWLELKVFVWVGLAAIALAIMAVKAGGVGGLLMQRGIVLGERVNAQLGGHWSLMAASGVVAPLIWAAARPHALRRAVFWTVLGLALVIKFAATGSRGGTIIPLLIVGAIWMIQRRSIPYGTLVVGLAVGLFGIGLATEFREATMRAKDFDEVTVATGPGSLLTVGVEELGANAKTKSGQLAILARVPEEIGHLHGESYVSTLYVFLPRALFGPKPKAGGVLNAELVFGRRSTAVPPGAVGEAYWNFSYAGVIIAFLIFGAIWRLIGDAFRENAGHPLVVVLYVYILFYLVPTSEGAYNIAHALVPVVAFWLFGRIGGLARTDRSVSTKH